MELERICREARPRALATLVRLLGDLDVAEEALQEAFVSAVEKWAQEGVPGNPSAWLVSTARHKALDQYRRRSTWSRKREELTREVRRHEPPSVFEEEEFPDDMLRLVFTCCHPALAPESRIALTLKTVCGLTVEEIARAFLTAPATMAQRLVRTKAKIRKAGIPYEVPVPARLGERLDAVLRVVYLVFTEGYAATAGDAVIRRDLCAEAIRLARLLVDLLPRESEPTALLALLLLQDSRREARTDAAGDVVLLEDQDRSLWNRDSIQEGLALVERSLRADAAGFYALQAAVAAVHARARRPEETDWEQIAGLYDLLQRRFPSPVVALNRAVAVAMARRPEVGLRLLEELGDDPTLRDHHLYWSARADLLRRSGRNQEATDAYARALDLATQGPERRFLKRRLRQIEGG